MKARRILLGMASMGYSKLVLAMIQIAMVPGLAHAWGLTLYGQWLLLSTIPVFLGASDFGFATAASNRMIGEIARGEESQARHTFQSAQVVILSCSLFMLAVALAICMLLPSRMLAVRGGLDVDDARAVLAVLCIYGIVALQTGLFVGCMRSAQRFAMSTTIDATVQLAEGMAVLAVALTGGRPLQAALAYLITRTIGLAVQIVIALRLARWVRLGFRHATRAGIRSLARPALAAMMLPLAQAGYMQGTALAVGAAAGPAVVPVFTSLRTLSRVAIQLLNSLSLPILPELTAEHARGNFDWVRRIIGAIATLNFAIGAVAALGLGLFGHMLLAIWTKGAIVAPPAMIILTAVALAAGALWNPLANLLLAVNRHEGYTYVYVGCAGLALAGTFLLVRQWGVTGAAAANLLLDLTMLARVIAMVHEVFGSFAVGPRVLLSLLPALRRR